MANNPNIIRILVAFFILLPFKTVAQITLALSALVFIFAPFDLARLYALITVAVVQLLAKLHRKFEAERCQPPLRFLDTHVHLWHGGGALPPWLISDISLAPIAVPRTIRDYTHEMGSHLDHCIYMEVDVAPSEREREANEVVSLCAKADNPLCGCVIGAPIVDGSVDEFREWVRRWSVHTHVKGVRQVLHPQPHRTCLRADIIEKARICGEPEIDFVFELCMRADDLEAAAELAAMVPMTRFVLDHCGGHHQLTAAAPAGMRTAWEAGIKLLARLPNVYCKLSGLMGAQGGTDGAGGVKELQPATQKPTVRFCVDHFPPHRLLFGGDWPVCTLSAPLSEWAACCAEVLDEAGYSRADKAQLAISTAHECYRLSG